MRANAVVCKDGAGRDVVHIDTNNAWLRIGAQGNEGDLLVVTVNGYGKRTKLADYPRKGRGGLGVKTVQLTEARGHLVGARIVRDDYQVMLISNGGTVIKIPVSDVKRLGRSTQGVIVMRLREGEQVSALAPVVEPDEAQAAENGSEPAPAATGTA